MISNQVIQGCLSNERTAHKLLYEACAPYLYHIVRNYVPDQETCKDALQDSFAHIFHDLKKYDESKSSFKTWITRIAINRSLAMIRKSTSFEIVSFTGDEQDKAQSDFDHLDHLSKEEIEMLLCKMPTGYRTVFLLSVMDGYNHGEIAEMLQISKEASRSQLSRGISWLKKNIVTELKEIAL